MSQFLQMASLGHQAAKIWLAAIVLLASTGVVGAQEQYPAGPDAYYRYPNGLYEYRSVAPSRWDRHRFHRSGTRGRMGLGADPIHPEGPGNVSQ